MTGRYHQRKRTAKGIAAAIEDRIASDELSPGAALPSIRALAADLDVNPNTVSAAYRQLRERGVVETDGRRGTRVRPRPATTARSAPRTPLPAGVRNLTDGGPDPRLLPTPPAPQRHDPPVGYEDEHVEPRLASLARAALRSDGVPAEHFVLTSGALDGVERVLTARLRPGDPIAVEDPGWANLLDLIAALGMVAAPVPIDDEGMLPACLRQTLDAGARATIVTSRAQNPTGATLSAERATELRAVLAQRPETVLIEDDHGAGIAGVGLHSLADATNRWAFVRSVAKAYGPDLRLAMVTGDATTIDRVAGRQRLGPGWVSHLLQRATVALWDDPKTTRNVADARQAYARRRAALVDALAAYGLVARGRSGLNVWVPVPDETAAVSSLVAVGWAVAPGAPYRLSSPPGIRISIAALDEDDVPALSAAIAAVAAPMTRQSTRPTVTR